MDKSKTSREQPTPFSELDTTKAGSGLPPESIDETPPEWQPAVDIGEDEREYLVVAALPGLTAGDVDVRGGNGIIEIAGTARLKSAERKKRFVKLERPLGDCHRAFAMPPDADLGALRHELNDGILHVHVPKARMAFSAEKPLVEMPEKSERPLPVADRMESMAEAPAAGAGLVVPATGIPA